MIGHAEVLHQVNLIKDRLERRFDLSQNKLRLIKDYCEFINVCLDRRSVDKEVKKDKRS